MAEPLAAPLPYSRANPSPRYLELVVLYRQMHREGDRTLDLAPEQTFPGKSLFRQAGRIKKLITAYGAKTLLDYGAGKGLQYAPRPVTLPDGASYPSILAFWGIERVVCYDPAYPAHSALPEGRFDGVISTDVLEHCPEEDIGWILDEIFGFARGFVFANIACFPARKRLPNGENAHCTVRPPEWWGPRLEAVSARHAGVHYYVLLERPAAGPAGEPALRTHLLRGRG